ncbi:hypothetical protein BOX15_Mlig032668g1 [Macrostomum lignano]|uniref:Apple domain-containing protein n=2 Tax=Macrostomum lignano TaxID=282301 RepID=A0A267E973_9PLAT|nr:hypothetical protein BOX15_Mlig032668g1 [Macrostomum lignano]
MQPHIALDCLNRRSFYQSHWLKMKKPDEAYLVLLLLPLMPVLLLGAVTDPAVNKTLKFHQSPACPPASVVTSMKLQGVKARQTCAVECSLRSNCAVYNFVSSSSECQMGSTADLIGSWTPNESSPCTSQLNPRLPGILTFRANLLAFLDFRVGQDNLIGGTQFKVSQSSPGVVYSSSQGAVFPTLDSTGASNYIELDKQGSETIANLLGRNKIFTVYARISRQAGTTPQSVYTLTDCNTYAEKRGGLSVESSRAVVYNSLTSPDEVKAKQSAQTFTSTYGETSIDTSIGAVFKTNEFTSAFVNGVASEVEALTVSSVPTFKGAPECIRLGFSPEANKGLVGRYICFAIVKAELTAAEFSELDALCG